MQALSQWETGLVKLPHKMAMQVKQLVDKVKKHTDLMNAPYTGPGSAAPVAPIQVPLEQSKSRQEAITRRLAAYDHITVTLTAAPDGKVPEEAVEIVLSLCQEIKQYQAALQSLQVGDAYIKEHPQVAV